MVSSGSVFAVDLDPYYGPRQAPDIPSVNMVQNLTVGPACVSILNNSYTVTNGWKTAFQYAINQINSSGSAVHMQWVENECSTRKDIVVYAHDYEGDGTTWEANDFAYADIGNSNEVGSFVLINPEVNTDSFWSIMNSDRKINSAMHELMHNLGIMHIYTSDGLPVFSLPYGNKIHKSVMLPKSGFVYPTSLTNIDRLNYYDKKTLQSIYSK